MTDKNSNVTVRLHNLKDFLEANKNNKILLLEKLNLNKTKEKK